MSSQGVEVLRPGFVSPEPGPGLRERIGSALRALRSRGRPSPLRLAPVAARSDAQHLRAEIAALEASPLFPHERFLVAAARAPRIPALLHEIGRQREIAFRGVGEGTGRELDLDVHDRSYLHLLVWDRRAEALAGAYRVGEADALRAAFGPPGLYTHSLFELGDGFFERIGPALELGRAFVAPGHQRSSQTLLLLWKGLARLVAARPPVRTLFGAVSISCDYSAESRALMAAALSRHHGAPALSAQARARTPFRPGFWLRRRIAAEAASLADVAALSERIAVREPGGRGLPVLVEAYLKLGGRFVAWNVDPDFRFSLDGLVVVDLAHAPRRLLEFYMGRGAAAEFLAGCAAS